MISDVLRNFHYPYFVKFDSSDEKYEISVPYYVSDAEIMCRNFFCENEKQIPEIVADYIKNLIIDKLDKIDGLINHYYVHLKKIDAEIRYSPVHVEIDFSTIESIP